MSPVTPAEARAALQRFIDSHFAKDGKTHARFTIPPRDDDDDMLLTRFIAESESTAAKLAEPASDRRARAVALMGRAVREGGGLLFIEEAFHLLVPDEPPGPALDLTELRTALHAARAAAHSGATIQSVRSALDHVDAAVERLAGQR